MRLLSGFPNSLGRKFKTLVDAGLCITSHKTIVDTVLCITSQKALVNAGLCITSHEALVHVELCMTSLPDFFSITGEEKFSLS